MTLRCMNSIFLTPLFMVSLLAAASPSLAAETAAKSVAPKSSTTPNGPRKNVWSIGLTGNRHYLKSGETDELLGNSASVQLGTGRVAENWYTHVSLDIILGPYEPAHQKQIDTDFTGTGLTVWTGFSAQTLDLRTQAGGYGFALGLSYADIVGRSQGNNRQIKTCKADPACEEANGALVDNYIMRVTNLMLQPAIFFSWLSEARPEGNAPELLKTRLEGYFLTLGMAIPVISNYRAKYETLGSAQEPSETVTSKGRLRGYSLVLTVTAMFGT